MRIGVDIDEVLCETNTHFIEHFNKKHGSDYKRENLSEYNYKSFSSHDNDFVMSELKDFIDNNLDKFEVLPNAKKVLSELKNKGHKLVILTSRRVKIKERTINWLKKNFGEDFFDEILIYNGNFKDDICKSEIAKENNIDILIEDAPHHALNTANDGIPVLLFDCPWNKNIKDNIKIIRVKNWNEVNEKIKLFL